MANPANQLPPEYDDIQPRDYDPAYTVDISTRMRVPDRIGAVNGQSSDQVEEFHPSMRMSMNIPEKLQVFEQGQHMSTRDNIRYDPDPTVPPERAEYVGLSTPPRVLKLDENAHVVDDNLLGLKLAAASAREQALQNGYIAQRPTSLPQEEDDELQLPVTPRGRTRPDLEALTTPGGGLLLQDSDDTHIDILHRQVMKLTRHVVNLQQENERRSQREVLLYPVIISYVLFQLARWFLRSN